MPEDAAVQHVRDQDFKNTSHQGCYVFEPEINPKDSATRPAKRRKTSSINEPSASTGCSSFIPLLRGNENLEHTRARLDLFDDAWVQQERNIESLLHELNVEIIEEVADFVTNVDILEGLRRIPTGLIVAGPSVGVYDSLLHSISERIKLETIAVVVNVTSSQATNLKSLLKYINRLATDEASDSANEEPLPDSQQDRRYLNYDLQILYDLVKSRSISRVVLSFQDSEAFEGSLLADLIDVLSSWNDRIPFVLLFGIATSIELFQDKLSRNTIKCLRGKRFDVARFDDTVELIFKAATSSGESRVLWLGPGLSETLLQRQKGYVQSIRDFVRTLKYAYMTHFFANPLSIFLGTTDSSCSLQHDHYEAIRNLPSFREYIEELIKDNDLKTIRNLLNSDTYLYDTVMEHLKTGQKALGDISMVLEVIGTIQIYAALKPSIARSDLYIKGMSGELAGSTLTRDILLSINKLPSNIMSALLLKLSDFPLPGLQDAYSDLEKMIGTTGSHTNALRSEHDIHYDSLRTTIVAQKVKLSKHRSALSKDDAVYSKIVNRVHELLGNFFEKGLANPQTLFLHELFIYDSKSPHRDVFTPKPRFAVERAFSSPHDYLGCICCDASENGLSSTQPATAIIYQLYLESGALINISDLWSAFRTIVGADENEDEDSEERRVLALFSQALSELKYMGMIKNSRKKADHLVKLSWKGL